METIKGTVERIVLYNEDNGFCILKIKEGDRDSSTIDPDSHHRNKSWLNLGKDEITAVGNLPQISEGEYLILSGEWDVHPKFGKQLKIVSCDCNLPVTVDGIEKFLNSGMIRGVGLGIASNIVAKFGAETFNIFDNEPEKLLLVKDIGPHRKDKILESWKEQKYIREVMMFLIQNGISTNLAFKIFKEFGSYSITVVKEKPFQLAKKIRGIGFKTADIIAQKMGIPKNDPERLEAGIIYTLDEASKEGHVYLPQLILIEQAANLLGVYGDLLSPTLSKLSTDGEIIIESAPSDGRTPDILAPKIVFLPAYHSAEKRTAEKLVALSRRQDLSHIKNIFIDENIFTKYGLSDEQKQAVRQSILENVTILTGGPGTGKTTSMKALIEILDQAHISYALAAPTGRAAKRLTESTGKAARTIHRLLESVGGHGFQRTEQNPLAEEMIILDEFSMVDILLLQKVIDAIKPGCHLLMVGDIDQLPSVGPGNVLRDLIGSKVFSVNRLQMIFRQEAGSMIISNAHKINHGKYPDFAQNNGGDFYLFKVTSELATSTLVDVVVNKIPKKFGFDPFTQIQVLAPMYKGMSGVDELNTQLQNQLNPAAPNKAERKVFNRAFRVGDKVMQLSNNYDKEVFNGDIGIIKQIDPIIQEMIIDFDGLFVSYDWRELDQLTLAYAVSVHKSQGSEFDVIVIPVVRQHYVMLQRKLFYTAVTRAKKICVLVGEPAAIQMAINNNKTAHRNTTLLDKIKKADFLYQEAILEQEQKLVVQNMTNKGHDLPF